MKAYNDFTGYADPADCVVSHDRRSPFANPNRDGARELHNAKGLVIAVVLSAACWAMVGFALLTWSCGLR